MRRGRNKRWRGEGGQSDVLHHRSSRSLALARHFILRGPSSKYDGTFPKTPTPNPFQTARWKPPSNEIGDFQRIFFPSPYFFLEVTSSAVLCNEVSFPFSFPKELDKCGRLRWTRRRGEKNSGRKTPFLTNPSQSEALLTISFESMVFFSLFCFLLNFDWVSSCCFVTLRVLNSHEILFIGVIRKSKFIRRWRHLYVKAFAL